MIRRDQIERVLQLRASGESLRGIARTTGVGRSTVAKILSGEIAADREAAVKQREVAPYRCGGCGVKVTLDPCVICAALRFRDAKAAPFA